MSKHTYAGMVKSELCCYCLQNFKIGEEKLISMAKQLFNSSSGQKDPSALSDDFRFEFPIVSLGKEVRRYCHKHLQSLNSVPWCMQQANSTISDQAK